jgi:cytochrome P450
MGFGHGAHVCIRTRLARLKSTLIFNTLFDGVRLEGVVGLTIHHVTGSSRIP